MSKCKVEHCEGSTVGRGYCRPHYTRFRVGMTEAQIAYTGDRRHRTERKCNIAECTDNALTKGLCELHYERTKRGLSGKSLSIPNGEMRNGRRVIRQDHCNIDGCEREHYLTGYCQLHYNRAHAGRDMDAPVIPQKAHGERYSPLPGHSNGRGYMCVRDGLTGRAKMVHRVVMEAALGRELLPTENVHHVNGVRDDNRLENLELWTSAQPGGQRVVDKVAWAREMLDLYGALYPVGTQIPMFGA